MQHEQVGRLWNENADAWTRLARDGFDIYRDGFNTPAFLELLPEVRGLRGLDIGCGEGHNTRLLARRGAVMAGIDIADRFIHHAKQSESQEPLGIEFGVANALSLPFADGEFDFATGFMSFMDIPGTERVVAEAHRILKPGGFLQFSICHPCFHMPRRRTLRDDQGLTYAVEVGDYFRNLDGEIGEWTFSAAPAEATAGVNPFRVPRFTRTLSQWFNTLVEAGFRLERVAEPSPTAEAVHRWPKLQDATVAAWFLHIRVRK